MRAGDRYYFKRGNGFYSQSYFDVVEGLGLNNTPAHFPLKRQAVLDAPDMQIARVLVVKANCHDLAPVSALSKRLFRKPDERRSPFVRLPNNQYSLRAIPVIRRSANGRGHGTGPGKANSRKAMVMKGPCVGFAFNHEKIFKIIFRKQPYSVWNNFFAVAAAPPYPFTPGSVRRYLGSPDAQSHLLHFRVEIGHYQPPFVFVHSEVFFKKVGGKLLRFGEFSQGQRKNPAGVGCGFYFGV